MPSLRSDTPMLERVTTASSLSSSTPPLSNSSNGSASKPRLHVDDDELCARAEAVARALDFRGLAGSNESSCRWILNKSHGTFTTYARRLAAMTGLEEKARPTQQVLAAGEIRCHLEEVVHVLNTTTDFDHNAVMSGLYRKDFIYGSVVHVVPSNAIGDDPKLVELLQEEESTMTTRVAVKTGAFVHSKLFSRNEQWCFLERAQHIRARPDPTENSEQNKLNSFTLTLSSLDEGNSRQAKYVRVIFFGQFNGGLDKPGLAKSSQMRARLVRLADGATRLPEIVRRRRFGAQTMADHAAFSAKNSHCTCCTKSLHLLTRKHRCHLCGHFVCDRCWSVQKMENQDTRRVTPVRMCSRCMEFVENGDYSAVKPSALGKIQVMRDPMDQPPPNKTLARLLQKELRSSSGARKNSVHGELNLRQVPLFNRIMDLEDASELDMLCSLAASQLDCSMSIVTVVTADQMTVLGSNKEDLRRVTLPREHSFCQHAVMTSKPLLVPHPEADIRFQNINGRTAFDVRFYCGFPIVDENKTVIGSLCCMDQKTHEMTQSQYSAMKKLAAAAELVVRSKN
ncbi:GAF domain-like [Phytophthora cactorum]|nr:GAF domain-like [Phytophthora cactorum]